MTSPSPIELRLARIEQAIRDLAAEVVAIRRELDLPASRAPRRSSADPTPSADLQVQPDARRPGLTRRLTAQDLERLVGSYGMLAIAVLAAVAAVGTFLSWAITHGYVTLGPTARVIIGLLFAAAIGVWGARLRKRERSFGSSLLGLALVIVHVCAYAAGPSFALVPTWAAFLGAATASWSLAVFAHRENDEPLWCVGFGGAAVAPFVTSSGHGSLYALLAYGTLVLLSACFAINRREWPIAWRVFYIASALFSIAGASAARLEGTQAYVAALAFPFLIATAGVAPFAVPSRKRGALRWLQLLAVLASAMQPASGRIDPWIALLALLAAAVVSLLLADRETDLRQSSILARGRSHPVFLDWIDVAAIPLAFVSAAAASGEAVMNMGAVYLASAAAFVAFAWRRPVGAQRDAAAFATTTLMIVAVQPLPLESPTGRVVALLIVGAIALACHRVRPSRAWIALGAASIVLSASISVAALVGDGGYHAAPFLTEPSATALIVLFGLVGVARSWRWLRTATRTAMGADSEHNHVAGLRLLIRGATTAPWVWAFLWILIELALAFSPTASTLLLVTYFAAAAVVCVAIGRVRRSSRLRRIGLGLAVVSAGTAVYGANSYFDFGARIVAYLVTSAFLLGIAYWYRRPGASPAPA